MNRFEKFLIDPTSIKRAVATDLLKKIFTVSAIALLFVSACAVAQGQGAPTPQTTDIRCALFRACEVAQGEGTPTPQTQPVNYTNAIQIGPYAGVKGDLAPIVRIV